MMIAKSIILKRMARRLCKLYCPILLVIVLLAIPMPAEAATFTTVLNPVSDDNIQIEVQTGSSTHWNQVLSSSTDSTYVSTTSSDWRRDRYNLADFGSSPGTIASVTVHIRVGHAYSYYGVEPGAATYIRTGKGVEHFGAAQTIPNPPTMSEWNWAEYSTTYSTVPGTSSPWTLAEINSLQVGVSLKDSGTMVNSTNTETRCSKVWVTVEYRAPFTITPASLTTTEGGSPASFSIRLDAKPTAPVTIELSSSDISEGTVSPASVTFTADTPAATIRRSPSGPGEGAGDWSGSEYTKVDEYPPDNEYYILGQDTNSYGQAYRLYTFPSFNVPSNSKDISVTVYFTARENAWTLANNSKVRAAILCGGLLRVSESQFTPPESNESFGTYSYTWSTNPINSALWTVDEINGVSTSFNEPLTQIGVYASDLDPDVRFGAIWAEVNYTTESNWNIPQAVTVTPVDDLIDDGNITYSIVTDAASSTDPLFSGWNPDDVSVTNNDNDTSGIVVSPASLTTTEGGSNAQFTVKLNSQPTANVTVGLTSADTTEGTVSPASLTFLAPYTGPGYQARVPTGVYSTGGGTWTPSFGTNLYQPVADNTYLTNPADIDPTYITSPLNASGGWVAFSRDAFNIPSNATDISVTVGFRAKDSGTTGTNNLRACLWFGGTPSAEPVSTDPGSSFGLGGYTWANNPALGTPWTVSQINDVEAWSPRYFGVYSSDLDPAIAVSQVYMTVHYNYTVAPNWSVPQTVTVTPVDEWIDDGNITYNINAATTGGDYTGKTASVSVTNNDNDTASITVNPTSGLVTTEAGGIDWFSIKINTQPTADVTINLSSSDATEGSVSPTSVTFTPSMWGNSFPKSVTITGLDDAIDDGDIAYSIVTAAATSTDSVYNGMNPPDVSVTNTDNDDAPLPTLSVNDVSLAEGNSGQTNFKFTVSLSAPAPAGGVTFNCSTADNTATWSADYVNTSASMTIPAGSSSATVPVGVFGDTLYEANETFYVNITGATGATISDGQAVGTIINDDAAPTYALTMAVSPGSSGSATDNTGASPYSEGTPVSISASPAAGYHFVNWTAPAGSFADANAASTTFTMPAQAVTVTANFALDTYTVSFDSQGGSAVVSQTVTHGGLVVRPADPVLSGYTFAGWYKDAACTDDWVFASDTVTSNITLYARWAVLDQYLSNTGISDHLGTDILGQTFTAGVTGGLYKTSCYLYNQSPITLTTQIQGVTDGMPNGTVLASSTVSVPAVPAYGAARWVDAVFNEPLSITAGERYAIVWSGFSLGTTIEVHNTDAYAGGKAVRFFSGWLDWFSPDFVFRTFVLTSPGITVTPATDLITTETGGTDTFTIVLNSLPTADVSIGLSSSDTTEGTISPTSLTFTATNWNTPQTVTVTGVDDDLLDGDISYTLSATASSADLGYHGLTASVSATNKDVEGIAPVVSLNPDSKSITYGDNTTFTSSATGTPSPTVQWQVSTDGGSSFTNISDGGVYNGTATNTLSLTRPPVSYNDYQYRAVFTNGFAPDTTSSAATLTVTRSDISGSFTAANKVYDGTTATDVTSYNLTGVLSGDTVILTGGTAAFTDKNAGTDKTVTLSGASLTGADAGNYNLTSVADAAADITAKPISPAIVANDKTYDGTTAASLNSQTVSGVIGSEVVNLVVGSADFAGEDVGTWTVTAATLSLSGTDAANYGLASATATDTADINALGLTISGAVVNDKIYDGTVTAVLNFDGASLAGVIGTDDVSIDSSSYSATFTNEHIGTEKMVTVLGVALSGTDAANYTVTQPTGLTADITRRDITGSFTAANKVYDGTTAADVTSYNLTGVLSGDTVILTGGTAAFTDKNAGTDKTVTLSGASLTGADAGNYNLTSVADAAADITVRAIDVTAVADTKVYDGTTASDEEPIVTMTPGLATGDSANWSQTFYTKDAGNAKMLTPVGTINDGNGGANYAVTFVPIHTGVIEKAELTVTADDKSSQFSDPRLPFTAVISGFIPDETLATSGVSGSPSYTTSPNLGDPITQAPGSYLIIPAVGTLTADNYSFIFVNGTYTVTKETATIIMDMQNPVSVNVITAGEGNAEFTWQAKISQTNDGNLADLACIKQSDITLTFSALGSGGGWSGKATSFDPTTGVAIFDVPADVLDVETYAASVTVVNDCFQVSSAEDVLVIYDPSLGFTTGGGWFYWPEGTNNPELEGAKTNFGFTMKYNRKGTSVQGGFLMIAHLEDGSIIRIKSNAINGLAIVQNTYPGIASFSGKCVYSRVDADGIVLAETGNQDFTVYVKDMDEPGSGTDMFWFNTKISITGEYPFSLDSNSDNKVDESEYTLIGGGNIVVPHKGSSADPDEETALNNKPRKK